MIVPGQVLQSSPVCHSAQTAHSRGRRLSAAGYGPHFWLAYASNMTVCVAIAVLYRYADFVTLLGGTEYHLGWIVGVGMIGSLLTRLMLGAGIDRSGPRITWLASLAAFSLVCFLHLAVARHDGPAIYLLRIAYCLSIAGIFGSSMTFISGRVPAVRMAEMIGMLGTSGFVGMVLGAQLGDLLCGTHGLTRTQVNRMFVVAGLVGMAALVFAALATRRLRPPRRRKRPPLGYLLRRYQPGTILVVAAAAGAGLSLPQTFLPTYAAGLGIPRIGLFFAVYSATAVATRVLTRRWPQRVGLAPMVLLGLAVVAVSQFLLMLVEKEWAFVIPGLTYGVGHAILFPTIVATGCHSFPVRYRGLGTMVVLSAFDVGTLLGAPAAGAVLHHAAALGLPSYPAMFTMMAAMLAATAVLYAFTRRPAERPGRKPRRTRGALAGRMPHFEAADKDKARAAGAVQQAG